MACKHRAPISGRDFKDGTSLNNDGTIHDKKNGNPNPSNKTRKWLKSHGWKVND